MYDPVSFSVPTYRCARTPVKPVHRKSFFTKSTPASHPIPVYHEAIRLCLSQGTADLGAALAGRQAGSLEGGLGGLGDLLISLSEDELDVAGVGHVGVDLKGKKSVPVLIKV